MTKCVGMKVFKPVSSVFHFLHKLGRNRLNRLLTRGIWEICNIFNLKKVPKLDSFRVKSVNFPGEGRFGCFLQS